jgi:diphthine-ammonia ligase
MSDSIFCSWSGGKDCCAALDKFMAEDPTLNISLLTMMDESNHRTYGHFLTEKILDAQAKVMNLEINFGYSGHNDYEEKWTAQLLKLKDRGFTAGIFGDIDLEEHYVWIERVMKKVGMQMLMPLWKQNRDKIVLDLINRKFSAKIISINKTKIDPKYLGYKINIKTFDELKNAGIDPSAEGGEFHTIIYAGPLFKVPLRLKFDKIIEEQDHIFYDLQTVI